MTRKRKKPVTAAELLAELNKDPEFRRRRQEEDAVRQVRAAEWRRAEAPLVEELRAAGFDVDSAWNLVNTSSPYPKALPILLRHVSQPYPGPVREGIARALAVPPAKFGWDVLIELYRNEEDLRAKDGLAVALSAIADDELIGDVIALVRDPRHGPSRLLLLAALERSRNTRARETLEECRDDDDLKNEIRVILRRMKRRKS